MTTATATPAGTDAAERADLLAMLGQARFFLRYTVQNLSDEQARQRTTPSELTLGGLVKHVAATERGWIDFIEDPATMKNMDDLTEDDLAQRADDFRLLPGETLAGVLAAYEEVAARTDALVATADLAATRDLPQAPWFQEPSWSVRRILLHVIAETTQHAGHADIIREALDGQKTMG